MIKKLLLSMIACVCAFSANAQQTMGMPSLLNQSKAVNNIATGKLNTDGMWVNLAGNMAAAPTRNGAATAQETTFEEEYWWSNGRSGCVMHYGLATTPSLPATFDFGTLLPSNYIGAVVDSICIFIYDKTITSDVKVWIGSDFYDSEAFDGSVQNVTVEHDASDDSIYYTMVKLDKPYTFTGERCVIGYTMTVSEVSEAKPYAPIWVNEDYSAVETAVDYGLILRNKDLTNGWTNVYAQTKQLGNLAIMAYVKFPEVPLSVTPPYVIESTVVAGDSARMLGVLYNDCYKPINNIHYVLTIDNVALEEQLMEFSTPLTAKSTARVALKVPTAKDGAGLSTIDFEVTKVNGEANKSQAPKATGNLIVLEESAPRIAVAEQFTSLKSGLCAGAHVGMMRLKQELMGSVITLSSHYNDVMYCEDYYPVIYYCASTLPYVVVDRNSGANPYFGENTEVAQGYGLTKFVEKCVSQYPSEATIKISGSWTDDSKNTINVSTKTNFLYERLGAADNTYAIAFVLSEVGMTGSSSDWHQLNSYYGATNLPSDLAYLSTDGTYNSEDQNYYIQTAYNNVVVAAWTPYLGISGSVDSDDITPDATSEFSQTLSIEGNTLIQRKDNLYLTALLINRNNYSIVNADQLHITSGRTGITGVTAENDALEVVRYNANGQRIATPQKGLNIIKLSNGKTVKTIVK